MILRNLGKLLAALVTSVLLVLPVALFRVGFGWDLAFQTLPLVSGYGIVLTLWLATWIWPTLRFVPKRSFEEAVFIGFLGTLPMFVMGLLWTVAPAAAGVAGGLFQFGMMVGLVTTVPYATLDHPHVEDRRYWRQLSLWFAGLFALASACGLAFNGFSGDALQRVAWLCLGGPAGLWVGLVAGSRVRVWLDVLKQVFRFVRSLGRPIGAFVFGYSVIVLAFGEMYAGLSTLEKTHAFSGLSTSPKIGEFLYFSLVTAATVGYGDIAPLSGPARFLASAEIVVSL